MLTPTTEGSMAGQKIDPFFQRSSIFEMTRIAEHLSTDAPWEVVFF